MVLVSPSTSDRSLHIWSRVSRTWSYTVFSRYWPVVKQILNNCTARTAEAASRRPPWHPPPDCRCNQPKHCAFPCLPCPSSHWIALGIQLPDIIPHWTKQLRFNISRWHTLFKKRHPLLSPPPQPFHESTRRATRSRLAGLTSSTKQVPDHPKHCPIPVAPDGWPGPALYPVPCNAVSAGRCWQHIFNFPNVLVFASCSHNRHNSTTRGHVWLLITQHFWSNENTIVSTAQLEVSL